MADANHICSVPVPHFLRWNRPPPIPSSRIENTEY